VPVVLDEFCYPFDAVIEADFRAEAVGRST